VGGIWDRNVNRRDWVGNGIIKMNRFGNGNGNGDRNGVGVWIRFGVGVGFGGAAQRECSYWKSDPFPEASVPTVHAQVQLEVSPALLCREEAARAGPVVDGVQHHRVVGRSKLVLLSTGGGPGGRGGAWVGRRATAAFYLAIL
jgi:hypothetical protein